MTISFNTIPIDIRVPGVFVEVDPTQAVRGLPGMPSRLLFLGQKLAVGTAQVATPVRVLSPDQAEELFGRGSQLHRMFRAAKRVNKWTESWAIPLADAVAGVAASGSVLFSGPATASGTVNLYIDGQRVRAAVLTGDTAANVATAVVAAITAATDLPVTAAVDGVTTEKVNITARHKGACGNDLDIRVNNYADEILPKGIGATVTAMNGGDGNPDAGDAIAVFGDKWWTDIIMPWTDASNLTALEAELEARWGGTVGMDALAYAGARGTHAALTTLGNSRNSPFVSIIGVKASPSSPVTWASTYGGQIAYHAKIDPARPFRTLPLTGVLAPADADRFTLEERNFLLHDGISTFTTDDDGTVRIERAITTYETNPAGVDDPSLLDVNTLKTIAYFRYAVRARLALRFPRHKLANDGTHYGPGQAVVTPSVARAELLALYRELEDAGLVEDYESFARDVIVERAGADPNRLNILLPPNFINQLQVIAAKVQFLL